MFFHVRKSDSWFTPTLTRWQGIIRALAAAGGKVRKARRLCNARTAELAWRCIQQHGVLVCARELYGKLAPVHHYQRWIKQNEPSASLLEQQRAQRFPRQPLISIIVPTYHTPLPYLHAMLESVRQQTYGHWELCLADGNSAPEVQQVLQQYSRLDRRIRVRLLPENLGIAGNSNAGIHLATGEYVALLDADDTLAPFALFEVVRAINDHATADFLYSDEDKITASGILRRDHHFKPDWSPDTMRSHNYICHLAVMRRSLLDKIGGFRDHFEGAQDYDLFLRATEQARTIIHIPKVLYHWRSHALSTAGNACSKMYAYESGQKALREHLQRIGTPGEVAIGPALGVYHINYARSQHPLVSIIVPLGCRRESLRRCLQSIAQSSYHRHEILLLVPGGPEQAGHLGPSPNTRVLSVQRGAGAALNQGASQATGDLCVFLRPELQMLNSDWLERMLELALRSEVGAVGGKIYYADRSVRNAGVLFGPGLAGRSHRHFTKEAPGYASRLITTQNLSAVTGDCLMIRKKVFEEIGGFDETFTRSYYDLDLCLRLRHKNYLIVWTPRAELQDFRSPRQHEDGTSCLARAERDRDLFRDRWRDWLQISDPYYNPNLTRCWEDFTLRTTRDT